MPSLNSDLYQTPCPLIIKGAVIPTTNNKGSIYYDRQSVHAISVVKTLIESIWNLEKDPEPRFSSMIEQIQQSELSQHVKSLLVRFCENPNMHRSTLTFSQVFAYVWQRICDPLVSDQLMCDRDPATISALRIELMRVLEEIISNAGETCLSAQIGNIVSALDGFFRDIRIGISDSERITAIVLHVRNSMIKNYGHYDSAMHANQSTKLLLKAGYTLEQFEPWIQAIMESDEE